MIINLVSKFGKVVEWVSFQPFRALEYIGVIKNARDVASRINDITLSIAEWGSVPLIKVLNAIGIKCSSSDFALLGGKNNICRPYDIRLFRKFSKKPCDKVTIG